MKNMCFLVLTFLVQGFGFFFALPMQAGQQPVCRLRDGIPQAYACQRLEVMLLEAKEYYKKLPQDAHPIIKAVPFFRQMTAIAADLTLARQAEAPTINVSQGITSDDLIYQCKINDIWVTHIRSVGQQSTGCASFSIRNIAAVLVLLRTGKLLTANNIKAEFDKITVLHDAYIAAARELAAEAIKAMPIEELCGKEVRGFFHLAANQKAVKIQEMELRLLKHISMPFRSGISWLKLSDIVCLAGYLGLERTYFLELNAQNKCHSKNKQIYELPLETIPFNDRVNLLGDSDSTPLQASLNELLNALDLCKDVNYSQPLCIPLCCVDTCHWRAIIIIKNPGEKAHIVILDSLNESFNEAGLYGLHTRTFVEQLTGMFAS